MAPAPVLDTGIALELPFIDIVLVALHVQLGIEVAFPETVLQQRPRRHQAFDLRQRQGVLALALHPYHTATSRRQPFAAFVVEAATAHQQGLVRTEGIDILPVDQHLAGIFGLERQLAAVEQDDLTTESITVVQPNGIGPERGCQGKKE